MGGLVQVDIDHFRAEAKYLVDELEKLLGDSLFPYSLTTSRMQIARSVKHLRAIFATLEIEKCACPPKVREALFAFRGRVRNAIKFRPSPYGDLAVFHCGKHSDREYKTDECDFDENFKRQKDFQKIFDDLSDSSASSSRAYRPLVPTRNKGGRPKKWGALIAMIETHFAETNEQIASRYNARFRAHRDKYGEASADLVRKYRVKVLKNLKSQSVVT